MVLSHEEKVSPVLGEKALRGAMRAGLIGLVAVIVFLIVMYGPRKALVGG